ncbi:MAG TPA: hypothetical protein VHE78_02730 [Gemmatimonadaceae bacterium]|nr:hypothetical protein [Gemmatimonadaceae bacterium]
MVASADSGAGHPGEVATYRCAIDDFGTGRAISEGWTMLALREAQAAELASHVKAALKPPALGAFHGKAYMRRFREQYVSVLQALRTALESSEERVAVCTLLDQQWKSTFKAFAARVIPNAFTNAGAAIDDNASALSHLALPLFELQRHAHAHLAHGGSTTVEIDADDVTRQLVNSSVRAQGCDIPALRVGRSIWEASRKLNFPAAPSLVRDGLSICDDETSPLIQVVDLLGNFSTAYVTVALGRTSKTLEEKRGILDEVFGDLIRGSDFSGVELDGDSDIRLKETGAFTLTFA